MVRNEASEAGGPSRKAPQGPLEGVELRLKCVGYRRRVASRFLDEKDGVRSRGKQKTKASERPDEVGSRLGILIQKDDEPSQDAKALWRYAGASGGDGPCSVEEKDLCPSRHFASEQKGSTSEHRALTPKTSNRSFSFEHHCAPPSAMPTRRSASPPTRHSPGPTGEGSEVHAIRIQVVSARSPCGQGKNVPSL